MRQFVLAMLVALAATGCTTLAKVSCVVCLNSALGSPSGAFISE